MDFANDSNKVRYNCTALVGTNKTGVLKPDENGYYTVILGALNAFNSSGAFYPLESGKKFFEESSDLLRRIREGNCKGELGHPKPLPGQTTREFLQRVLTIEETKVCYHLSSVWLQEGIKDRSGRSVVAILGKIKPSGPFGDVLKASLENPLENVCFSIRSLTFDTMNPAGYLQKDLRNIITWDVVTEAGLSACHKYNSPSLEALQEVNFLPEHLNAIEVAQEKSPVSLENANTITVIRESLGWTKETVTEKVATKPFSTKW